MARHNRDARGSDQRGESYELSYQPDWLRLVKVTRSKPQCAPSTSPPSQRGRAGFCDFCRSLTGWSIRAPHQACKQAARCFTKCLEVLLTAVAHGNHHDAGAQGNAQKSHGEIRNVEC